MSQQQTAATPTILDWFPLATEQLRLRSLSEVSVYHPSCQGSDEDKVIQFYITFHETPFSPPFYTSPPSKPLDNRVTWTDLDRKIDNYGGVKSVIVRLWSKTTKFQALVKDKKISNCVTVWGVTFSGLVCVGDKLSAKVASKLSKNSFVFKLNQHYFVCNDTLQEPISQARFFEVPCVTNDLIFRESYDISRLRKLTTTLRDLKKKEVSNNLVRKEISERLEPELPRNIQVNPTNVSASLRQQIFSVQPKLPATKMQEIDLTVKIENIKFKISLLKKEKERLMAELESKKGAKRKSVMDSDELNNHLLEDYHKLSKDKEKLDSWLNSVQESRDCNTKTKHALKIRRHQLISQLREIFPINNSETTHPTIVYVLLPSSEHLKDGSDTDVSVGLGWVAHLTVMVSSLLGVPLRYQVSSAGSKSSVTDLILCNPQISDKDRVFPLHPKGQESVRFEYGVYLLNLNISQLRWFCNLPTSDLKPTLSNLCGVLDHCCVDTEKLNSQHSSPARHQLPVAPPVLAGVTRLSAASHSPLRHSKHLDKQERMETSSEQDQDDDRDSNINSSSSKDSSYKENCVEINAGKNICDSKSDNNLNDNVSSTDSEEVSVNPTTNEQEIEIEDTVEALKSVKIEDKIDVPVNQDIIEEAVEAADVIWDSVATRTEALSVLLAVPA